MRKYRARQKKKLGSDNSVQTTIDYISHKSLLTDDIRFLMSLWSKLRVKRLVSRAERDDFLRIILKINNISAL
jgi:hypothetical protein